MKIKILSRNPDDYLRETKQDIHKVARNFNPDLHPLEAGREYTRALNAVKLQRVFAKPFVGNLDGHKDGIQCMMKHPNKLTCLVSGANDGEVKLWDLATRKCSKTIQAHTGIVDGMCFPKHGNYFFTVGRDKTIKQWSMDEENSDDDGLMNTILTKSMITGISHHWTKPIFATCGEKVDLWDQSRSVPIRSYSWGLDTLSSVKFNPIETDLLGSCASDRSIILYDTRGNLPVRKVTLKLKSNVLCWNPMEAFAFTVANEDYNLYTYDVRNLKRAVCIHMDHVEAVTDVDYAPTGREFVSGGYDNTVRIFKSDGHHSREVYHTKRMQRLNCVLWSLDNRYVLSASMEMNIRVWKANSAEKLGLLQPRERQALDYNQKLREKYAHHPQIRKIARHRHVPKHVYNGQRQLRESRTSRKRREDNRRKHSKPGSVPYVAEIERHVVQEYE